MNNREPIFNLPNVVLIFALIFLGLHAISLFDERLHRALIIDYAYYSNKDFFPQSLSYSFFHLDWGHVLINSFMFIAFGKPVALRLGVVKFIVFMVILSLAGALAQKTLSDQPIFTMIGASALTSGLFGALVRLPDFGQREGHLSTIIPLSYIVKSKQHIVMIVVWLLINYFFGEIIAANVAWEAHLGGFIAGFFLFPFLFKGFPRLN